MQPEIQRWNNFCKLIASRLPRKYGKFTSQDSKGARTGDVWYRERVGQCLRGMVAICLILVRSE